MLRPHHPTWQSRNPCYCRAVAAKPEAFADADPSGANVTHPGVGPVTALATEVFLGDPGRFVDGKALASYVGIIPREYSSGGNQRLGGITKQGSPLLRFLWCEAGAHAVRKDPELQRFITANWFRKVWGERAWR